MLVPVTTTDPSAPPSRPLSGRYLLTDFIARGGMADVYSAEDLVLERAVAVKLLRSAGDDADNARFIDEMLASSRLNHPGVVRLYDAGEHEGALYLVMELVDGHSLRDVIRQGPIQPDDVLRIGRAVAGALHHAHLRGIVHRDVKPGNILIDREGAIQLADFGIASVADHSRTTVTGTTLGTAGYLAPEQVAGGPVDGAADVYSLGLVLLEALTGRKEFAGSAVEAALARLHRDPVLPAGLGAGWRTLLSGMTAREPRARFTAAQVADMLAGGGRADWTFDQASADADGDTAPTPTPAWAADAESTMGPGSGRDDSTATAGQGPAPAARRTWVAAAALAMLIAAAGITGQLRGQTPADAGGPAGQVEPSVLPSSVEEAMRHLEDAVQP
jgi:eukaryotic-like serine/threonine-protein kinase